MDGDLREPGDALHAFHYADRLTSQRRPRQLRHTGNRSKGRREDDVQPLQRERSRGTGDRQARQIRQAPPTSGPGVAGP